MKVVIGIVFILFGLYVALFPQASAEATARTQRGWIRILPWLNRRDPNKDWMTDVGLWRVLNRVVALIMIFVGVRMLVSS